MEDRVVNAAVISIALIILIATLYPFLNILAISLNDATDTSMRRIYGITPRMFTFENYNRLLQDAQLYVALTNSVLRTVTGTACTLACCTVCAYLVYNTNFILHRFFTVFLIFTMYVSGGMIPEFIVMRNLGLIGTFSIYILPNLVFAFTVILIMSFMREISDSIIESARIDGAGDLGILAMIIVPLSLPILATIALFCAVGQWGSWFDVFLYNSNLSELSTLQFELQKRMMQAAASAANSGTTIKITPESIRATMTILATAPILAVYPFLQKYFVKGLTLGAVKG
jgi:putative aldouronate transport system permease protein